MTDIRIYLPNADGELCPTTEGLTLSMEQTKTLFHILHNMEDFQHRAEVAISRKAPGEERIYDVNIGYDVIFRFREELHGITYDLRKYNWNFRVGKPCATGDGVKFSRTNLINLTYLYTHVETMYKEPMDRVTPCSWCKSCRRCNFFGQYEN